MELVKTDNQTETVERMTRISDLDSFLKMVRISENLNLCPECHGTGMEVVEGRGARTCGCIRRKRREKLLAAFPERNKRFGVPQLANLRPFVPEEHLDQPADAQRKIAQFQKRIIAHVQKNPFRSLNLCGKNKIGKSQIAFSVLLNAFDCGRHVKFFKMKELLSDYATAAKQSFAGMTSEDAYKNRKLPRLTTGELVDYSAKYTILIDEFHNWILSSTESQFSTTFEILDAIKANRHQLIILSNYPFRWLGDAMRARYERLGESVKYVADAIISRINEEADTDELFF